jgi:hypothetical protein
MDTNADFPQVDYPDYIHRGLIDKPGEDKNAVGYLYQNYINTTQGHYRIFLNSEMTGYTDPTPTADRNLVYVDTSSSIYGAR